MPLLCSCPSPGDDGEACVPRLTRKKEKKSDCFSGILYFVFAIKSSILSNFMGSTIDMEKQMDEQSGDWCGTEQGEQKRVKRRFGFAVCKEPACG